MFLAVVLEALAHLELISTQYYNSKPQDWTWKDGRSVDRMANILQKPQYPKQSVNNGRDKVFLFLRVLHAREYMQTLFG